MRIQLDKGHATIVVRHSLSKADQRQAQRLLEMRNRINLTVAHLEEQRRAMDGDGTIKPDNLDEYRRLLYLIEAWKRNAQSLKGSMSLLLKRPVGTHATITFSDDVASGMDFGLLTARVSISKEDEKRRNECPAFLEGSRKAGRKYVLLKLLKKIRANCPPEIDFAIREEVIPTISKLVVYPAPKEKC